MRTNDDSRQFLAALTALADGFTVYAVDPDRLVAAARPAGDVVCCR